MRILKYLFKSLAFAALLGGLWTERGFLRAIAQQAEDPASAPTVPSPEAMKQMRSVAEDVKKRLPAGESEMVENVNLAIKILDKGYDSEQMIRAVEEATSPKE